MKDTIDTTAPAGTYPPPASMAPIDPEKASSHQSETISPIPATSENKLSKILSHLSTRSHPPVNVHEAPPDGGYGWVVVICVLLINSCTWGANSSYGVFLAHYLADDVFPGATALMYAFVGGLSISSSQMAGPLVTWILGKTSTKTGMFIGIFFETGGLIAASFASKIWHLFLTQGIVFGVGMGFLFQSSVGVASQWFDKKRSIANGLMAGGSGLGGMAWSLGVRAMISNIGLAWTFRTMACIVFAVNMICTLLMRDRNKHIRPNINAFDMSILRRYEFFLLLAWGIFSMFGYVVLLFSLPDYAASQGFTKNQGSILSAMLNLGMMFGRPAVGWISDIYGRINVGLIMTVLSGVSCFVIWMPASESGLYGVAVLFSLLNGAVCGTFWTTIAPITVEVVGLKDLTSALSLVWLAVVIPTTFSEPIALYLRRPDSSRPYLIPQIWCGVMYFVAGVALWLLRTWKLKNRDQKAMESSQETDTVGAGGVPMEKKKGLRKIREKWKQGSRWWRYDYV